MAEPSETEQYLAEVKERAGDVASLRAALEDPVNYCWGKTMEVSQADVATLVEMVQKLRSYLLYIAAETDIAVVHVKVGEGILDAGRIARAAREKSGD